MKYSNYIVLVVIVAVITSCLEPFEPDIPDSDQNLLVVDGIITNQPGPYTVKLSRSSSLNGTSAAVSGAVVSIEEENGSVDELIEVNEGEYQTTFIQGEIGKRYRLRLLYDEKEYQSEWEEINVPQTIDSIYFEAITRNTSDIDVDVSGLQFYLDAQGSEDDARYFRFEISETWKFMSPQPSFLDYIGNDMTEDTQNPVHTCWSTNEIIQINLGTTAGLTQNILSRYPVQFVSGEEDRFTRRYSILVQQYALSEKEFIFWERLKESNQELGSIFDRQPAQTIGNLSNVNDPDELVLGYFSASGLSQKRLFIDTEEIPEFAIQRRVCETLDVLNKFELGSVYEETLIDKLASGYFFIMFLDLEGVEVEGPHGAIISPAVCSDCTLRNGDVNEPEFWN